MSNSAMNDTYDLQRNIQNIYEKHICPELKKQGNEDFVDISLS